MEKDYVMTCSVVEEESGFLRTEPYRIADWFDPECMTQAFRLLDADGIPMYYGLTYPDALSFQAQDDYGPHAGCVNTEYFINGEWKEL